MANVEKTKSLSDKMIPLLVADQISAGGDETNATMKALLGELLKEQLEKFQKDRQKKDRMAMAGVAAAKEAAAAEKAIKDRCSHKKKNGEPRTGGQRLGNGQTCIVCTFCGSEWFNPPKPELGQIACPRDLYPDPESIGG